MQSIFDSNLYAELLQLIFYSVKYSRLTTKRCLKMVDSLNLIA